MNKQEIVALINDAIAGQGSQVDISGKLPAILSSIVDLIPEGGNAPLVVEAVMYYSDTDQQERLRLVGITKDEINETLETKAVVVHAKADNSGLEQPTFDYATGFANINHNDGLIITFGEVRYSGQEID